MIPRPFRRGQIWWVDWEPHRGSEQAGRRPALIIQTNEANELAEYDLTIVLPMSTKGHSGNLLHVAVPPSKLNNLPNQSYVKCEQAMTISKLRLDGHIGQLEPRLMAVVDDNLRDVLGL